MRIVLCTLAVMLAANSPLPAQEEFSDPYTTPKRPPYRRHDHLRIIVQERAKALSTTDLRTDRRSRWELSLDNFVRFSNADGRRGKDFPRLRASELSGDPGIDLDTRFRMDSAGRTSRAFDLTFSISAEIVDIRPNGNLVIEGRKRRKVNGETEMIRLSGEVSPENVEPFKTVRSANIANLDIEYDGRGTTGDITKPGLLGWLLGKLWPF